MELGTGIFLSATFLGVVALYIVTRDRWNWKKIILWPLAIIAGLSVIGVVSYQLYDRYQNRLLPRTSFGGISLGATPSDVKFAMGAPVNLDTDPAWLYPQESPYEGNYLIVEFKEGKVSSLGYLGLTRPWPSLLGFYSPYPSLLEIEEKLGLPSSVSRSKDQLERIYSFEKYNIYVTVRARKVIQWGIYDPQTGPMRYKDEGG